MPQTIKVAQTDDLPPGTGKVVEADGRSIALFNVQGTFHAIDNTCTHRGGPLGEGELQGGIVTCPWHGATFDVQTGAVTGPPARTGVRSFRVQVDGKDVLVELD
jgi:nitrite reductase (NADH) small subunit/3-phenylpropionate/trans-cinnamate dioxygenase ferredoxin subunit